MSKFSKLKNLSPWRKLSLVTWNHPGDPSVYGQFDCDGTRALKFIEAYNRENDTKVTLTHFFAKTMALIFKEHPELNGIIKWGKIYKRDTIDIFLQVAIQKEEMESLSGAKLTNVDQKSLQEIAQELSDLSTKIRDSQDPQFQKTFDLARKLPVWLLKPMVKIHEWAVYNFGLNIPSLGIIPDPFGTAMLTSVGSLGVPAGFAPLVPPSRCPVLICLGRITDKPWVVDGTVMPRPIISFTATFDHRFIDGLEGSRMLKTFFDILEEPKKYHS